MLDLVFWGLSILAAYTTEEAGSFSYNSQFATHLYREKSGSSFCALTTAPGSTSNGIDYRFALAFGDRNEVRLVTENPLPGAKALVLTFDDGSEFEFTDAKRESLAGRSVTYFPVSRSMMSKILSGVRGGGGTVSISLQFGSPSFQLPAAEREETWQGIRACEKARLGEVVPD